MGNPAHRTRAKGKRQALPVTDTWLLSDCMYSGVTLCSTQTHTEQVFEALCKEAAAKIAILHRKSMGPLRREAAEAIGRLRLFAPLASRFL